MRALLVARLICLPLLVAAVPASVTASGPAPRAALLVNAMPNDGSTVPANPHWVRLYFRTDVIVHTLEMQDADGRRVPLRWGGGEEASASQEALLPDHLADGRYDVHWVASDANGVTEDTSPTDRKPPIGPYEGHVRFTIADPAARGSGR